MTTPASELGWSKLRVGTGVALDTIPPRIASRQGAIGGASRPSPRLTADGTGAKQTAGKKQPSHQEARVLKDEPLDADWTTDGRVSPLTFKVPGLFNEPSETTNDLPTNSLYQQEAE